MPGPFSAPNGNARLTKASSMVRVCRVHGRRLGECAKARNAGCQHSLRPEREFLHQRKRLRTGKTAR